MKRKYADYYWSMKKTDKGWMWSIYVNYFDKEPIQTSLDNDDEEDRYLETQAAAAADAIGAIQDHYS